MTRLPKKRGITQDGEDKSLILRSKKLRTQNCMNLARKRPDSLSVMSSLKKFWAALIVVLILSSPTPASAHPDLVLYIDTAANIS